MGIFQSCAIGDWRITNLVMVFNTNGNILHKKILWNNYTFKVNRVLYLLINSNNYISENFVDHILS